MTGNHSRSSKQNKNKKASSSPEHVSYHPPGPIRLPINIKKYEYHPRGGLHERTVRAWYRYRLAAAARIRENNNIEQAQKPSARAAHHRGQNAAVAAEKPAAPTRSAGALFLPRAGGHDHFVRSPSANHPCCTRASSSGSRARRASHGNACRAKPQQQVRRQPQQCQRSRPSSSRRKPRRCQLTRRALSRPW